MYTVQVLVNIENEIKTIEYQARTSAIFQAIMRLYENENYVTKLCINRVTGENIYTEISHISTPLDNFSRLFLVHSWLDDDDSKIWAIIPPIPK